VDASDGNPDGAKLGVLVGAALGASDGAKLGVLVGAALGASDGAKLGVLVGAALGASESGIVLGGMLGASVGAAVGLRLGDPDGARLGDREGATVHASKLHATNSDVAGQGCATPSAGAAATIRVRKDEPPPHSTEQLLQPLQLPMAQSMHVIAEQVMLLDRAGHAEPPPDAASLTLRER
jgi:hypothetical protein